MGAVSSGANLNCDENPFEDGTIEHEQWIAARIAAKKGNPADKLEPGPEEVPENDSGASMTP